MPISYPGIGRPAVPVLHPSGTEGSFAVAIPISDIPYICMCSRDLQYPAEDAADKSGKIIDLQPQTILGCMFCSHRGVSCDSNAVSQCTVHLHMHQWPWRHVDVQTNIAARIRKGQNVILRCRWASHVSHTL